MNKISQCIAAGIIIISSMTNVFAQSHYLEAECGDVGLNWDILVDGNASRSKYVSYPSGNAFTTPSSSSDDYIRMTLTLTSSGTYKMWGRIIAPNASDDSFWVRVNEGTWYKWNDIGNSSSWTWKQVYDSDNGNTNINFSLVSGTNTIDFSYREDDTFLDKIFLTTTTSTPSGLGGDDTSCPETICYAVADDLDDLVTMDRYTAGNLTVIGGTTGASNIEALTISLDGDTIFAMNDATFGWLNKSTGAFNSIGSVGSGTGGQGTVNFGDVDGLTVDVQTGIYYGAERQSDGSPVDLIFAFDHLTGNIIPDFFGANVDYIEVRTDLLPVTLYDVDDIAMSPQGTMYVIANSSGINDRLAKVDLSDGSITDVGRINDGTSNLSDIESLSFDYDGILYFISSNNDNLYRLDTSNAVATLIGNISYGSDYEGIVCLTDGTNVINGRIFIDNNQDST